jgi:hypothetical protein
MARSTKQRKAAKRTQTWQSEREQTQPAEEWGERIATGRAIARGGGNTGAVPGATEHTTTKSEVVVPPAPPGESEPEAVRKTQAVSDALAQLGGNADPQLVAQTVKSQTGIDLAPDEAAKILCSLHEHAEPPCPDLPPKEDARRMPAITKGRQKPPLDQRRTPPRGGRKAR